MTSSARVLVAAGLALAAAACLDIHPLREASSTVPNAGGSGGSGGEASPTALCDACLSAPESPGPGCSLHREACRADPQCEGIYQCGIANDCFAPSDLQVSLQCFFPCILEQHIASYSHPTVAIFLPLAACAQSGGACVSKCVHDP